MRLRLPTVAKEVMRWGTSQRDAAALVTATLIDVGLISPEDPTIIVDQHKIRREVEKIKKSAIHNDWKQIKKQKLKGIFFNGKEIQTLIVEEDNGVFRQTIKKQDHIILVGGPGGKYIGHVTPLEKAAELTAVEIINFLDAECLIDNWALVGADSTAVNTVKDNEIIARCERHIGHRLHWDICLLHTNKLPLRHLVQKLDGPTSGSASFKGPIGKMLADVEKLEWDKNFLPIVEGPELCLEQEIFSDLSTDQKYLFLSVSSIRQEKIVKNLKHLKAGPLSHARWLTLACQLCWLYISKHKIKGESLGILQKSVFFVVTNRAPLWFETKQNKTFHILRQVQLLRLLPLTNQEIVAPYIKLWHAHSENLLVAMISSDHPALLSFAVSKLLNIRKGSNCGDASVRVFISPKLNFNADSLCSLIDWDDTTLTESILTSHLSVDDIIKLKETKFKCPLFSAHTQAVERLVREDTHAWANVAGHRRRDGFIRARIASRKVMSNTNKKSDLMIMSKVR